MNLNDLISEAEKETAAAEGTELSVSETTSFPIPENSFVPTRSDLEVCLTALANMNIIYPDNIALDNIHNHIRESIGLERVEESTGLNYAMTYMSASASNRQARTNIVLAAWEWDLVMFSLAISATKGPKKHRENFRSMYSRLSGERNISQERLSSVGCSGCGMIVSIQTADLTAQGYRCPLCS